MTPLIKIRIFLRSFLLQAGWNFKRLQNIGFAFVMMPLLERIYSGPELKKAIKRHLETFNTQPFMASFAFGLVGKMEEDAAKLPEAEKEAAHERIRLTKQAVSMATAAIGDRLFWGTIRPLTLVAALAFWWIAGFRDWVAPFRSLQYCGCGVAIAGLVFALVLYNLLPLIVRWKGIGFGHDCEGSKSCGIDFLNWQKFIRLLRLFGFIAAVLLTVFAAVYYTSKIIVTPGHAITAMVAALVFLCAFAMRRFGWLNVYLYIGFLIIATAVSAFN